LTPIGKTLTKWLLMAESAQEFKYFLARLLGPRPTFPMDITAEERDLMGRHSAYWKGQMAAGKMVVFGPVLDPAGVWGLGVMRAKDEAEVRALQAGDPVIAANCGFRYETLPMLTAVVPSDLT
jgi:uncharacterized protein YciI